MKYMEAEMEVVAFATEDVITTSVGCTDDCLLDFCDGDYELPDI